MLRFAYTIVVVSSILVAGTVSAEIVPDFLMDSDPELHFPDPVKNFTRDYSGPWIQALDRPDVDLQRMAAATIADAHRHGIPGLTEAVPSLERILVAAASHPAARFAVARSLIVLDSRESAEKLLNASQRFGSELRQLVEPTLADWNTIPARTVWMSRLDDSKVRHRDLVLAMRGLGQVRESAALPALQRIVRDVLQPSDLRLEAASAAGQLADANLEKDAGFLANDAPTSRVVNRVCAIRLLARHDSEAARDLMKNLAMDAEPAIAAAALERLNEIDPNLVVPLAESAMKNNDSLVRNQGASAYLSVPSVDRIAPLAQLLDDPHPKIRKRLSDALFHLAKKTEFDQPIRDAAMDVLAKDSWRGQEQAAFLLGALEHKPASWRLVELLESPRHEVLTVSAWALRKVADPQSVSGILNRLVKVTKRRKDLQVNIPEIDDQTGHLMEACGQLKAIEAIPVLREYVPKNLAMGERSRCAAIYSLGWLNQGLPDSTLCDALFERVMDFDMLPMESIKVKQFSVVSIARMKSDRHGPLIRKIIAEETPLTRFGLSCRWAVNELTGESLPEPDPDFVPAGVWFLEPLESQGSAKP